MGVTIVPVETEVDRGMVRVQRRVSTNYLKGSGGGMVWSSVRMIQT